MEPSTDVLVIVLAGLGLLVGHTASEAADPPQAAETMAQGQVAQSLLVPGRTVRVSLSSADDDDDDGQLEGTLVDANENSLRIRRGSRVVTVPWPTARSVEVSMTHGPRWEWLPIGIGVGVGSGAVLALQDMFAHTDSLGDSRPQGEARRAFALRLFGAIAVGAAIGTTITFLWSRRTDWTDVPPPRLRVGLLPTVERNGFGLTIAASF